MNRLKSRAVFLSFFLFLGWLGHAKATPPAQPPSWRMNPIAAPNAQVGMIYQFNLASYVNDPDNEPLTFSLISGPAWLAMTPAGLMAGVPSRADVGADTFTVTVTGAANQPSSATVTLTVVDVAPPPPHPPTCTLTAKPQTVSLGGTTTLSLTTYGDVTSATIQGQAVSVREGHLQIVAPAPGTFSAYATVSGPAGSSNCFTLYKVQQAPPPIWNQSHIVLSARAGEAFTFDLSRYVVNPSADNLTFRLLSGCPWIQISADGILSGTPSMADVGTCNLIVAVMDEQGGTSDVQVDITVPRGYPFRARGKMNP